MKKSRLQSICVALVGLQKVTNYSGGEPVGRREVEVRVNNLKNGGAVGKDEVSEEEIKNGGESGISWIWKLYNMDFESDEMPEDWRSTVTVPLCKGKGEGTEYKNSKGGEE